jgi:hypothetical protein
MEKNIIDLDLIDNLSESGVLELALVGEPAINKIWIAMAKQKFVNPSAGESEDEFIPRCIAKLVGDEGYETDQAAAICYSTWSEGFGKQKGFKMNDAFLWPDFLEDNPCWEGYEAYGLKDDGTPNCIPVESKKLKLAETYTDYPEGAVNNAKRALDWADKNGWGDCGMGPGKARANQLANREPISEETIARMSAFERHRQNSETPYSEGCGKLMWDAWGGDAGIRWAKNKLREIRGEEFSYDTSALPAYTDQVPKKKKMKMESVELDIYGYRTSDFHMCPGAVATFQHLMEMNPDEETIGMIRAAAVIADSVFDLEEEVIEEGVASPNDVKEALVLVEDFIDVMGEIDKAVGMEHDVAYMVGHVEKIKSYLPALEQKMSKQYFSSEDQQILVGPVAIPDIKIVRQDEETKEVYWVKFSKEVIQRMAEKFMKENRNNETNIEHDNKVDAKSYIYESWIVESENDKANSIYNLDVPVGTWVVKMRVTDPEVWKQVKSGELNGFSLEGSFIDKKELDQINKDKSTYEKIINILKSI